MHACLLQHETQDVEQHRPVDFGLVVDETEGAFDACADHRHPTDNGEHEVDACLDFRQFISAISRVPHIPNALRRVVHVLRDIEQWKGIGGHRQPNLLDRVLDGLLIGIAHCTSGRPEN